MTRAGWHLDELAHVGPEHLDLAYAAMYDAKTGADLDEELALLQAHGLDQETTLVDLGAGTGALALAAAPHCRRVVAVDPSPAMLAIARERAETADAENLERIEAWLAGAAGSRADGWMRAELEEHVRAEHSTFAWLLEPLLEHAGFEIQEPFHRRGVYSTYVCTAR